MPLALASWAAALLVLAGYVLPGERLLTALQHARAQLSPLRVDAELAGEVDGWPDAVFFEIHPELGVRAGDDAGGRWLVRNGRVIAGTSRPAPGWIPELELLALRTEEGLRAWLERARVDVAINQLGRAPARQRLERPIEKGGRL